MPKRPRWRIRLVLISCDEVTKMPIMDQNAAAAMLAKFLAPGGGNVTATDGMDAGAQDMLASQQFSSDLQGENDARLMNDPTNPILQERARQYADREAKNPYSETSSLARLSKAQESTDIMNRFLANQPMRDRQATDAGTMAEDTAYGHSMGDHMSDYGAEISPAGNQALNARGARDVAVAAAKAKGAGQSSILQNGSISLPPGMAPESLPRQDGESGNSLVQSDRARQIFEHNGTDDGTKAIVAMVLDYRLGAPEKAALARSGQMQKILGLAANIDPTFDASQYDAGAALRKDMTTGVLSKQIQSLTRIQSHMGTLRSGIDKLDNANTGAGIINPFMNWFNSEMLGKSPYSDYTKEQNIVDGESANTMSASGVGTDQGHREQAAGVGGNSAKDIQVGHANTTQDLLDGQSRAARNKVSAVPRLLPFFDRMMKGDAGGTTPTAPDPSHPVVGQHGTVNGRDAVWDGSNWVAR